jgi:hypothetical protein
MYCSVYLAANENGGLNIPDYDEVFVRKVTKQYNQHLRFDASLPQVAYTIRDPVVNGMYPGISQSSLILRCLFRYLHKPLEWAGPLNGLAP